MRVATHRGGAVAAVGLVARRRFQHAPAAARPRKRGRVCPGSGGAGADGRAIRVGLGQARLVLVAGGFVTFVFIQP